LSRPKQHHYVTKAYLDGFLAPRAKHLFCYGRGGKAFKRQPDEIAMQRNFYAYKNEEGEWDDSTEEMLEREVERPGLPIIKKLSEGRTRLNWKERQGLSLLIAFQETRTPAARQNVLSAAKIMTGQMLKAIRESDPGQKTVDLIDKTGKMTTATIDDIVASYADLDNAHSEETLRLTMGPALELHKYYKRMKYTVHYPLGPARFITTDTPVIRIFHGDRRVGTGVNRYDVEIRFPLSSNALLTITHDFQASVKLAQAKEYERAKLLAKVPEVRIRYVSDAVVAAFNKAHAKHARVWAFAPTEVDWMNDILAAPSAAPETMNLSNKDLFQVRSKVKYDPKSDPTRDKNSL
jgi:hypothetical protein